MTLKHNNEFDSSFSKLSNLDFYPYVGEQFGIEDKRIMIYAHNIYCESEKYESELIRTNSKTHFADAIKEFTYKKGYWTKAFQNFLKGILGFTEDYSKNSDPNTLNKIDSFVSKICYTNFINGLVKSDAAIDISIPDKLIKESKANQNEILQILNITHCITWGKNVYNHIIDLADFEIIESRDLGKKGFGYAKIKNVKNNQIIHVLKIYHPSMPSFGHYKKETHSIFKWFLTLSD